MRLKLEWQRINKENKIKVAEMKMVRQTGGFTTVCKNNTNTRDKAGGDCHCRKYGYRVTSYGYVWRINT